MCFWFIGSYGTQSLEDVIDFIFKPKDSPSTQNEIITVCNRTRAARYLLRDLSNNNSGHQRSNDSAQWFKDVMQELEKDYKRMVPTISLLDEEEVKQLYPNLISEISRILHSDRWGKSLKDA